MKSPARTHTHQPLHLSANSQALTNTLSEKIHQTIRKHGPLSFSSYMNMALYTPNLGYYMAGQNRFGAYGDFITAPQVSPLFGQTLAMFLYNECCLENLLELGAGNGLLAAHLLTKLEQLNTLPNNYYILEVSAALQQEQQRTLFKHCPHLLNKVHWLKTLPDSLTGTLIANEVLDALPVDCFTLNNTQIMQNMVDSQDNELVWRAQEPTPELQQTVKTIITYDSLQTCEGYTSEINLSLSPFINTLAEILRPDSHFIAIDYGYSEESYYHPQRHEGTLTTYYQHRALNQPLLYPGLQDITAHVNFTQVLKTAEQAHLIPEFFTTQADFLLTNGLLEIISDHINADGSTPIPIAQAMHTLTDPARMGEVFKVFVAKKHN